MTSDVSIDLVEKVSRAASGPPSTVHTDDDDYMKDEGTSYEEKDDDDDVEMEDEPVVKSKVVRKPREKKVIPVGSNGLKKRKVTKTRKVADANGYLCEAHFESAFSMLLMMTQAWRIILIGNRLTKKNQNRPSQPKGLR